MIKTEEEKEKMKKRRSNRKIKVILSLPNIKKIIVCIDMTFLFCCSLFALSLSLSSLPLTPFAPEIIFFSSLSSSWFSFFDSPCLFSLSLGRQRRYWLHCIFFSFQGPPMVPYGYLIFCPFACLPCVLLPIGFKEIFLWYMNSISLCVSMYSCTMYIYLPME